MDHEKYMRAALRLAEKAARHGETPVGAVVVDPAGRIIGRGFNRTEAEDATCHAELEAIRDAARFLGTWRLTDSTLYVTMEPCPMCAGAVMNARLRRLVYGVRDERAGSCGSVINLFMERYDRPVEVYGGVLERECAALLRDFFAARR